MFKMFKMCADLEDDEFDCVVLECAPEREVAVLQRLQRSCAAITLEDVDSCCIRAGSKFTASDKSTYIGSDSESDCVDDDSAASVHSLVTRQWGVAARRRRHVRFVDEAVGEPLEQVREISMRTETRNLHAYRVREISMLRLSSNLSGFRTRFNSDLSLDSDEEYASGSDVVSALARFMGDQGSPEFAMVRRRSDS